MKAHVAVEHAKLRWSPCLPAIVLTGLAGWHLPYAQNPAQHPANLFDLGPVGTDLDLFPAPQPPRHHS